jgi:hypothetical protein
VIRGLHNPHACLLVTNLPAHAIFFVIELNLFGLGDMAAVLAGVKALLGADAAVLGMKIGCLGAGELALLAFLVNPARGWLVRQSALALETKAALVKASVMATKILRFISSSTFE